MEKLETRINSYRDCKYNVISKYQLARHGFYYVGPFDMTRCFACEVEIGLWESTDDVFETHARYSPKCVLVKGHECSVCMENPKSILFLPCRHVCVCDGCSKKIESCPVCRVVALEKMRVFIT